MNPLSYPMVYCRQFCARQSCLFSLLLGNLWGVPFNIIQKSMYPSHIPEKHLLG